MHFRSDARIVVNSLIEFHQESLNRQNKVTKIVPMEKIIDDLRLNSFIKDGGLSNKKLSNFIKEYLSYSTKLYHPAYLGHQCATVHYSAALGSLVDAYTNNVTAIYEMGPAAVSIEFFTINWMLEKVGWNPTPAHLKMENELNDFGAGVFINGGSLGNLTGLLAARNKMAPEIWQKGNPDNLALLVS